MSTGMEAIIEIPLRKRTYGLLLDAANEISGERWRNTVAVMRAQSLPAASSDWAMESTVSCPKC